jgi:hypothetical protein
VGALISLEAQEEPHVYAGSPQGDEKIYSWCCKQFMMLKFLSILWEFVTRITRFTIHTEKTSLRARFYLVRNPAGLLF